MLLPLNGALSPLGRPSGVVASTLLNGLVGYWKLDEASGSRSDSAGSSPLTDNNTVTQAVGKVGNAAQFTAVNSEWLSHADNAALGIGAGTSFTFSAWTYMDDVSGTQTIIGKDNSGAGQRDYLLRSENPGTARLAWYCWKIDGSTLSRVPANSFGNLSAATWYHVLVDYDQPNGVIGITVNNGVRDTIAHFTTGVFHGTADFTLGWGNSGGSTFQNGRIDEVGLWKRLLTAAEKTTLYNGGNGVTYPAFT